MAISWPQLILSILLFAVLFFGIGFIINMLLKTTWLVPILYPFIMIIMIDKVSIFDYFTHPSATFSEVSERIMSLAPSDITVLFMGFVGAVISAITIKTLRKRGYEMF